jgi:hypothetical protein
MDGIAAITSRITEIQSTVAALNPQPTATTSAGSFASVLATEVTNHSASTTGVDPTALRVQQVGAYGSEQLSNAAAIIKAGQGLGLSVRDQTIGVMTAIGESSLRVVDHGDTAGPDSRGLFQQRANGAWGTYADRMNPTVSATSFFTALAGVQGRDSVAPTIVAHTVQRNADPQYYTKYWDDAVAIVAGLTGTGGS